MIRTSIMFALAWLLPATAAAQGFSVRAEACEGLDVARLETLMRVELSSSELQDRAIDVRLRCDAVDVQILVSQPLTDHRLERTLPRPLADAPERALAIAIAQLLRASWTELLISLEELRVRRAAPAVAPPVPERAPPPSPPRDDVRLDLRVGARAHDFVAPFPSFHGALALGLPVASEVRLIAALGFEIGRAERTLGSILMHAYQLALGVELELLRAGVFVLSGDVLAAAGYVVIAGQPARGSFGGSSSGFAGDLSLGVSAWFELDRLHVGVRASIGGGPGVEGRVVREASVQYGRGFAGLSVMVGAGL